jgi:CRISPR-associated endonuclease/helicase Cas3
LHGPNSGPPDVNLLWRADLSRELLEQHPDIAIARVDAAPPGTTETISLPLYVVAQWLRAGQAVDIADVDGVDFGGEDADAEGGCAPALAWRARHSAVVSNIEEIRAGDTIIVPCAYGGLEGGTFSPADGPLDRLDEAPGVRLPIDWADRVQLVQRGRPTLRLSPETLLSLVPDVAWPKTPSAYNDETTDPEESDEELVRAWFEQVESIHAELPSWLRETLEKLSARGNLRLLRTAAPGAGERFVARARHRVRWNQTSEVSTEDDRASFTGVSVSLGDHLDGVAEFAKRYVEALELPRSLAEAIVVAARFHDVGKADLRFQALLRGGDRLGAEGDQDLLAKSDQSRPPSPSERAAIRRRSELPDGWRHELLSVAMLQEHDLLRELAEHADLVLHLVGSHHGWCRPLAPVVDDPESGDVKVVHAGHTLVGATDHGLARLDSGISRRFWKLNARYGWHGLAWLEAILRLADHRRSEAEQRQGEYGG